MLACGRVVGATGRHRCVYGKTKSDILEKVAIRRPTSLMMACRYGNRSISSSCGERSSPITLSSSSCARSCTPGKFTRARTSVCKNADVVSAPPSIRVPPIWLRAFGRPKGNSFRENAPNRLSIKSKSRTFLNDGLHEAPVGLSLFQSRFNLLEKAKIEPPLKAARDFDLCLP
jgi:hypothetical protein